MTVETIFDYMGVLNNELDLSDGGTDESRALTALQMTQDYFEAVAASLPRVLQSTVNVAQAANTETSTWPSSLIRFDGMWMLNSDSRPVRQMKRITDVGGHVPSLPWPIELSLSTGSGAGRAYYANMEHFYWLPLPASVASLRIYGMLSQTKIAARATTWPYPDRTGPVMASFACMLMATGVGDEKGDLVSTAQQMFGPLMRAMRKFDRSAPMPKEYTDVHTT